MAQTEDEKLQANLFDELSKNDVTVTGEDAEKMKEDILNDRGSNYLGLGIHEVYIKAISLVKAKSGTFGIRFDVENADGKNDATFWLSDRALPYTIKNISAIIVHNTAEDKKEAARVHTSNITSAKEIFELAQQKLIGGVAWLSIRESKTQEYTDSKGEIKPSLEKNLSSWKPKEDAQQMTAKIMDGGTPAAKADLPF